MLAWLFIAYRSRNFIVGLTNSDPTSDLTALWNYTVCGQYPGAVPNAATVTLQCTDICEPGLLFRYVVVQFPLIDDHMNFCEIEVYTVGTYNYFILIQPLAARTTINVCVLYGRYFWLQCVFNVPVSAEQLTDALKRTCRWSQKYVVFTTSNSKKHLFHKFFPP